MRHQQYSNNMHNFNYFPNNNTRQEGEEHDQHDDNETKVKAANSKIKATFSVTSSTEKNVWHWYNMVNTYTKTYYILDMKSSIFKRKHEIIDL